MMRSVYMGILLSVVELDADLKVWSYPRVNLDNLTLAISGLRMPEKLALLQRRGRIPTRPEHPYALLHLAKAASVRATIRAAAATGGDGAFVPASASSPLSRLTTLGTLSAVPGKANAIRQWLLSILAGLMSSSCCLLQLGINLLSAMNIVQIGCAGFNKVLGPLRLQLRIVTLSWLVYSWVQFFRKPCMQSKLRLRLILQTSLCLFLTFLPELLLLIGGPALDPTAALGAERLVLDVGGMGCEACSMKVKGLLDQTSGILSSHVDFTTGKATIDVAKDTAFNFQDLVQKLTTAGYGSALVK